LKSVREARIFFDNLTFALGGLKSFNEKGDIEGFAISNAGLIVGRASKADGKRTPPTDLNSFIASALRTLVEATAISNTGFISGVGLFDNDGIGPHAAFGRTWSILVPQAGTYGLGDANFDTATGFADLVILAQHYDQPNSSLKVDVADFDLNGVTNFQDLEALAQSLVLEPATIGSLDTVAGIFSVWRRRCVN
jgi:hypothetical protein